MKTKTKLLQTVLRRGLKPIEKLSVSEWAGEYRIISAGNAEAGRWRNSRTPYLKEVMDSFTNPDVRRVVLKSSAQIGKALSIATPIKTINGWKRMETIQIGDRIYDECGKICSVIGISEVFKDHRCFRIQFNSDSEIVADADHIWQVEEGIKRSINLKEGMRIKRVADGMIFTITKVEEIMSEFTKCIAVDSPSHLYLAGELMIPTHNSECINNVVGRFVHLDPCPMMIVQPTIEMSQDYSKRRLAPMIRDCSVLSRLFYDDRLTSKSRDANQTILSKYFPGGSLVLAGANSPAGLASRPIRIVLFDEVDRFPLSAASEGDPVDIASKRTSTFWNSKIGLFSTPTLEGESRIEEVYLSGTQEEWCHVCPNCGALNSLLFENIFEENGEIYWKCPDCGGKFPEIVMKNAPAMYVAKNPDATNRTRSFYVNAFSSPWVEWRDVLREYAEARGNPEREQVVVNTRLGKTYKPRQEIKEISDLLQRREKYGAELPDGILLLTAGVDVQDSRLEYEIVGWGIDEESWGIKRGMIIGKPSIPRIWELLDEQLDFEFSYANGSLLKVYRTFIDSGGHFTSSVYEYCKMNQHRGRFAIKGIGRNGIPLLGKTVNHEGILLTSLGVNEGKSQIYSRLQIMNIGAQYSHFPLDETFKRGYDETYFRGLMSEHLVEHVSGGRRYMTFEPIAKTIRNEPLDLRVYALAAMKSCKINGNKWRELAKTREFSSKRDITISQKRKIAMRTFE